MNSSNESVLAIGTGTFGPKCVATSVDDRDSQFGTPCDSHLVCVQDKATLNYHTEVMSMHVSIFSTLHHHSAPYSLKTSTKTIKTRLFLPLNEEKLTNETHFY